MHPSETKRVSAVAVGLKDISRKTGAAILALSSATKAAEQQARDEGRIDVSAAARDSLAIIHAADGVLAMNTQPRVWTEGSGDKKEICTRDQWYITADMLSGYGDNEMATQVLQHLQRMDAAGEYPTGWSVKGKPLRACLSLERHRGATGDVPLYYERAFHAYYK